MGSQRIGHNWATFTFTFQSQRSLQPSCCSVAQLCQIPGHPMDWSMPGSPVLHYLLSLLKLMSIESVMPSNHLASVVPFSSRLKSFPASGSFPMSRLFTSGGHSTGVAASASVLPMNIQIWFPLSLTGLISLKSKGLSSLLQHHSSKAAVLRLSAFFMV